VAVLVKIPAHWAQAFDQNTLAPYCAALLAGTSLELGKHAPRVEDDRLTGRDRTHKPEFVYTFDAPGWAHRFSDALTSALDPSGRRSWPSESSEHWHRRRRH